MDERRPTVDASDFIQVNAQQAVRAEVTMVAFMLGDHPADVDGGEVGEAFVFAGSSFPDGRIMPILSF